MENENNSMDQGSTYHFGRNESSFGRENVYGRPIVENQDVKSQVDHTEQSVLQGEVDTSKNMSEEPVVTKSQQQIGATYYTGNPYQQGTVYGQGIYTGDVQTAQAEENKKKDKKKKEKAPSNGKVKRALQFVCLAVVFGLIAGSVMVGVNVLGERFFVKEKSPVQKVEQVSTADTTAVKKSKNLLFSQGLSVGSKRFSPKSVASDQLLCLPLPFTPSNGFS